MNDILTMGHATTPLQVDAQNQTLKGLITGGVNTGATVSASTNTRSVSLTFNGGGAQAAFADATNGYAAFNPNRVYDSDLYTLGGTTSTAPITVLGELHDSFVGWMGPNQHNRWVPIQERCSQRNSR